MNVICLNDCDCCTLLVIERTTHSNNTCLVQILRLRVCNNNDNSNNICKGKVRGFKSSGQTNKYKAEYRDDLVVLSERSDILTRVNMIPLLTFLSCKAWPQTRMDGIEVLRLPFA